MVLNGVIVDAKSVIAVLRAHCGLDDVQQH
jgi:ADP-ribose pyrophosphatase